MIKVAINGFGRIGRTTFRRITDHHPNLKVVAINDLTDSKTLTHLLKYDSVYGRYEKAEEALADVKFFAEKDPADLAWKELAIDIVLECTGEFASYDEAKKQLG